jgi:hypothetical protein
LPLRYCLICNIHSGFCFKHLISHVCRTRFADEHGVESEHYGNKTELGLCIPAEMCMGSQTRFHCTVFWLAMQRCTRAFMVTLVSLPFPDALYQIARHTEIPGEEQAPVLGREHHSRDCSCIFHTWLRQPTHASSFDSTVSGAQASYLSRAHTRDPSTVFFENLQRVKGERMVGHELIIFPLETEYFIEQEQSDLRSLSIESEFTAADFNTPFNCCGERTNSRWAKEIGKHAWRARIISTCLLF